LYDTRIGPFVNLSDLPLDEAEAHLERIRQTGQTFASQRTPDYLTIRRALEAQVRESFIRKGGQPKRERPHYMILGTCPWLLDWYRNGCEMRIPLMQFDPEILSFTYGDTFPALCFVDGKPFRGQVYCLEELPELVHKFGMPQALNPDGKIGLDRYIEAQIWDDTPLLTYLNQEG
jgi:hypothetical protein